MRERVNEPAIIHFLVLDRPSEAQKRPVVPAAGERGFRESRVHDHERIGWINDDQTDSVTKVGRASDNEIIVRRQCFENAFD